MEESENTQESNSLGNDIDILKQKHFTGKTKPINFSKFFDYIIPVVPIVSGENSYDFLLGILKESGIKMDSESPELNKIMLRNVSKYINDARFLKMIVNDYFIRKAVLAKHEDKTKSENNSSWYSLDRNKIFAISILASVYPKTYNKLFSNVPEESNFNSQGLSTNELSFKNDKLLKDMNFLMLSKLAKKSELIKYLQDNEYISNDYELYITRPHENSLSFYGRLFLYRIRTDTKEDGTIKYECDEKDYDILFNEILDKADYRSKNIIAFSFVEYLLSKQVIMPSIKTGTGVINIFDAKQLLFEGICQNEDIIGVIRIWDRMREREFRDIRVSFFDNLVTYYSGFWGDLEYKMDNSEGIKNSLSKDDRKLKLARSILSNCSNSKNLLKFKGVRNQQLDGKGGDFEEDVKAFNAVENPFLDYINQNDSPRKMCETGEIIESKLLKIPEVTEQEENSFERKRIEYFKQNLIELKPKLIGFIECKENNSELLKTVYDNDLYYPHYKVILYFLKKIHNKDVNLSNLFTEIIELKKDDPMRNLFFPEPKRIESLNDLDNALSKSDGTFEEESFKLDLQQTNRREKEIENYEKFYRFAKTLFNVIRNNSEFKFTDSPEIAAKVINRFNFNRINHLNFPSNMTVNKIIEMGKDMSKYVQEYIKLWNSSNRLIDISQIQQYEIFQEGDVPTLYGWENLIGKATYNYKKMWRALASEKLIPEEKAKEFANSFFINMISTLQMPLSILLKNSGWICEDITKLQGLTDEKVKYLLFGNLDPSGKGFYNAKSFVSGEMSNLRYVYQNYPQFFCRFVIHGDDKAKQNFMMFDLHPKIFDLELREMTNWERKELLNLLEDLSRNKDDPKLEQMIKKILSLKKPTRKTEKKE